MLVPVCLLTLKEHLCTTIIYTNKHNKCNPVQIFLYQYVFSYCRNSCPLSYPNVHYHVHKNTTVYTILSHMNPLHTIPPTPRSLTLRFLTECCTPVQASTRARARAHTHTKMGRFKFPQCLGLGLDDQEIGFDWGQGQELLFCTASHTGYDNQPDSNWKATRPLSWGVKQLACEADTHLQLMSKLKHGAKPPLPHIPLWLLSRYQGSFLRVKQQGCDVDHSPPSSVKIKNEWSYTFNPLICIHGMDKGNCILFFT